MSKTADTSLVTTMLPKLTAEQRAWLKTLPQQALEMVEDMLRAKGEDWYLKYFDSYREQMNYCLGFLD
jgi:hypothetical protein